MPNKKLKKVQFHEILAALLDDSQVFPPAYLPRFSDLEGVDFESLKTVWPQVNQTRRIALMEDLEDLNESDMTLWFNSLAGFALDDESPRVREVAVRMLWESSDANLQEKITGMMFNDPDVKVRTAAASALGKYVYEGELEEIPAEKLRQVEDDLLKTINGEDEVEVRRRALESMGFSGRPEVPALIRRAYEDGGQKWLVSALFAMGRSADDAWAPEIMRMLNNPILEVQVEAVRAAGELAIEKARLPLLRLLQEENEDEDVRFAAIWALSKIGGESVRDTLEEMLEETEDDEEAEFIENALDNLSFTEDMGLFSMFDFDNMTPEQAERFEDLEDLYDISQPTDDEDDSPRPGGPARQKGSAAPGASNNTNKEPPEKKKRHRH